MQNFEFELPTKIVFGPGSLKKLPKKVSGLGKKALIVIGQGSVKKNGYLDQVVNMLKDIGVETVIFEGIEPNPRAGTIDKAAELARAEKVRYVIALGGGSVMDASKCIAMLAVNEGKIWDYAYKGVGGEMNSLQKSLPLVCIPTVAATSSETDRYAVVTNEATKEKSTVFGNEFFPTISIIDPELTFSVSSQTTVDGAMDIIIHVLEDYLSTNGKTPLQDRFSLAIVKTVMDRLALVLKNPSDVDSRSQLSWASSIALSGFLSGREGGWPMHSIEHALSGHFDISHGRGLSAILPAMLQYDLAVNADKIADMGKYLFKSATAEECISAFVAWMKEVGAYCRLSDLNVPKDGLDKVAADVIRLNGDSRGYLENIKPMNKDDILQILQSIY
ncbi:MAG: iron-containing alcohol dehydrogenase [Candidatus Margulisiibacteriota bacterium]|jgi:alcohol dehydrogenase YqhD (iron-dependent ADH family)